MSKTIIVTGTPGTGKTTLAQKLAAALGYDYIDVNKVIANSKASTGYDRKKKCKIVDVNRLSTELISMASKSPKGSVIDSHLSHYLPAKAVDACVVTKCRLDLLGRRLKTRGYGPDKIRENLDCEIFDVCLTEAQEAGHRTIITECYKGMDIKKLIRKIKSIK